MTDPYKKHWNDLANDQFEWVDDEEDLKAFCPKCGFLKIAHQADRCPTEDEAEAFVLGGSIHKAETS